MSGSEPATTHNRMELRAVIEGLRALAEPCRVSVYSDSTYVVKAFNEERLAGWERLGWKTVNRKPVLNQDLWKELLTQVALHEVTWSWVKGHDGNIYNERADALATAACATLSPHRDQRDQADGETAAERVRALTPKHGKNNDQAEAPLSNTNAGFASLLAAYRAQLARFLRDHPTINDKAWTGESRLKGETREAFIARLLG